MDNIFMYIADCYIKKTTPVLKEGDVKPLLIDSSKLPKFIYNVEIKYVK